MRIRSCVSAIVVTFCLFVATGARADDLNPPVWRLSTPCSSFQHWDFCSTESVPCEYVNPCGIPQMSGSGGQWLPEIEGRTGVVKLGPGGKLVFSIPNVEKPEYTKEIWVQVTWAVEPGTSSVSVEPFGPPTGTAETIQHLQLPNGWFHSTFRYTLDGCPAIEYFNVVNNTTGTDIFFDQIVIDTRCVPEPATIAGLGTALGVLVLRRRRR